MCHPMLGEHHGLFPEIHFSPEGNATLTLAADETYSPFVGSRNGMKVEEDLCEIIE